MKVFGFAGWSGSGKTTLIERLIPRLIAQVGRVSLIKHAHHDFDVDVPGKDSWRHRQAGCSEILVTSGVRWALMRELRGDSELTMAQALARLSDCDLALVEGYKRAPLPKLEVWRSLIGKPRLASGDPAILAVATDTPEVIKDTGLPIFGLDDVDQIATFVVDHARFWPPGD